MEVIYNNNTPVQNGQYLKVFETQTPPQIKLSSNIIRPYVIVMYDPDAVGGTYLHWIKGSEKDFLSYKGPSPPPNTGEHHYVFEFYMKPDDFHPNVEERTIRNSIEESKAAWGLHGKPLHTVSFTVKSPTSGGKKSKTKKTKRTKTKRTKTKKTKRTKTKKTKRTKTKRTKTKKPH
jgi:hypothetical protein